MDKSGRRSQVVKVSDHGWRVMSSSPVPLKNRRVRERCTLNLSRAQTSSLCVSQYTGRAAKMFVLGSECDTPGLGGHPKMSWWSTGRSVTGSSPVPLKTRRVGQRCTLNLSRAETSSRWCGVVVRRGGCQLRCRPRHLTMVQNYVDRRQKPSCS
ncbi:uncharacterized protein TNCV_3391661 [Trichonephila clavipes]|nr:uncharacterized protein TNCV_3391661 [Trichonephila clavipes]